MRKLIPILFCLVVVSVQAQTLPPTLQADIESMFNSFTNNIDGKFLENGSVTPAKLDRTYLTNETDPVWTSASNLYYLQTEADSIFATGTPVYVEADPVWTSEKSGYATGTPVYVELDPVWMLEKSLYATGTPLYTESETRFTNWLTTNGGVSITITNMATTTNTINVLTFSDGLLTSVIYTNL